ncbi:sigma-70 family RNA polymerase sigma factor [uncultured Desulfuromonas sp.]|uniref:sigma-70 family RNA polymerase sigma factor n=1 Tax=uncultured Desulfuromonas sp. TaxID=181013 RepID=UPI002AAC3B1D|nr:sigma-70 family RNA polymerase sigma factor [uncultured Desulfuromonas sp.]
MSVSEKRLRSDLHDLYLDHHGWLVGWLNRRVHNAHDAGDLAQDLFTRLLGRKTDLSAIAQPRAWLATMAHGMMVDHLRRRDIERAYAEALAALPADHAPSPETHAMLLDTLAAIDALLKGLKPRTRTIFLLSRLDGLPYARIAEELGVSLSTVEKDMSRAIRHCLTRCQEMPL